MRVTLIAIFSLIGPVRTATAQVITVPAVGTSAAAIARARADSIRRPWTSVDVDFLSGMIHHHAQAMLMAGWANSHQATPSIRTLCERIVNAQRDEIRLMQQWLVDRRIDAPQPNPRGMPMSMGGSHHEMLMPGMLSAEQLARLDLARGQEFDQLLLTYMIQHHRGAVAMVTDLFANNGAGQDETIFKLASDIHVDQTTEVARMQKILLAIALGKPY